MPIVILNDSLDIIDLNKNPIKTTLLDVAYPLATKEVEKKMFGTSVLTTQNVWTSVLVDKSTDKELLVSGATNNYLLNAIIYAYNKHIGLRLTPDDILHCFSTVIVKCINDNAEKYRDVFVNHQGKMHLDIQFAPGALDCSKLVERMSALIDENVKSNLGLESNFSTSTKSTRTVSQLMKMSAFKKYFSYSFTCLCGIRKVDLIGTLDDWLKLREKISKCSQIFINRGNMVNWSRHFLYIVNQLIETFKGNVNNDFWSRIITYVPYGSGGQKLVSGWAKILFPDKEYDKFPDKLNLLDLKSRPPTKDMQNYYKWQDQMKEWAQLCDKDSTNLSYVEADLNIGDYHFNLYCTVGHLGWVLDNDFTQGVLAYVLHADAKNDISNSVLEEYREEQKKHIGDIQEYKRKIHDDYEDNSEEENVEK